MNYRHIYHAGNFADVFKHCLLIMLIKSLSLKDKAFCIIDSHAGIGRYDLMSPLAQKTHEFKQGIKILTTHSAAVVPETLRRYLAIVNSFNSDKLKYYPGSPLIARALLREHDRLILNELHTLDYETIKSEFINDKQVAVHHQDAYQLINAVVPPLERRGLVLIDPPFEKVSEFDDILNMLFSSLKKWPTGIYAVWYPIKDQKIVNSFLRQLKYTNANPALHISFGNDIADRGMQRCGMVIINPPWQFDQQLPNVLRYLKRILKLKSYSIDWLVKES